MTEYDTRSVLEGKNKEFCHLPTSRGFPNIIVQHSLKVSFFDPPKSSGPMKPILHTFEKIKFRKNGPRMKLDPPGCYPDHEQSTIQQLTAVRYISKIH